MGLEAALDSLHRLLNVSIGRSMDQIKLHFGSLLLALVFFTPVMLTGQQQQADSPVAEDLDDEFEDYRYKPDPSRVRLTSVIDEVAVDRFLNGEPIVIPLPAGKRQVVGAIRLEKPEFFKSQPFKVRLRSQVIGNVVAIQLPVTALDRLEYQPIEIPIYQSQVTSFKLFPDFSGGSELRFKPKQIDPDFYVRLKPNNGVSVAFEFDKTFRLTNEILQADLPFDEIAGIFFDNDSASVVMKNGDNITGKHDWPSQVEFTTPWGDEIVKLDEVVSITRNRYVRLVPSGAASPKWVIMPAVEENPIVK